MPPVAVGPRIEYQVQEGEALIAIAETFGVSRRLIILANEGMSEKKPYTLPGDVIVVPVSPEVALQLRQASSPPPGFIRFIE
jgi:LysM repeat protein